MDGVTTAATIITVIQISQQVFSLCKEYFLAVKDAREDIQRLSDEVTALHDILKNVEDLATSPSVATLSTLMLLRRPDGPVEQCLRELKRLEVKLDPGHGQDRMKRLGLRALKWPLSGKDVDKTLSVMERQKALFNLALTADQT
jgi:hypothetical protein